MNERTHRARRAGTDAALARLDHALQMMRTYLADCADREDWDDPRTAELTEVIRSCVERISVNRRGNEQSSYARVPQEALRHALGYVDEQSDTVASGGLVNKRAAA